MNKIVYFKSVLKGEAYNITAMLTNDASNSHPDVIKSTDGGQTFSIDTIGLQADAFGTVLPTKFLNFKGKLWMAVNYHDIYTQGASNVGVKNLVANTASIYPNPFTNTFEIKNNRPISLMQVYDMTGNLILRAEPNQYSHSVDLSNVANGVYIIHLRADDTNQILQLIKK